MFIVEGNIGAGKSTFLTLVQQALPHISIAQEPVNNWQQQVAGNSLLQQFYEDPHRWAYTLETYTMTCRVLDHLREQQTTTCIKLMERSIYSGHYCFAKNGYHSGVLSELEWVVYKKWFDFLIPGKCSKPKGFIYLQTDPIIAHQRMLKRSRSAESSVSFEYLQQIHSSHEDFLIHKKEVHPELHDVPVLVLDCNEEFEHNSEVFNAHLKSIEAFMFKAL